MEPVDTNGDNLNLEGLPDGTNAFKINFDDLEFGPMIGKGGYGKIFKGEYFGTPVGIKEISLSPRDSKYKELIKFIQREVAMLRFSHPHLVQFIGVSEKGANLYIVTEFVVGGDLAYYLFKNKNDEANNLESFIHKKVNIGSSLSESSNNNNNSSSSNFDQNSNNIGFQEKLINLSWPLRIKIAYDVSCAMAYLHSRNVIHRDLKSTNLLVGDGWRIKVCDFGFARTTYSGRAKRTMTICGSSQYIPPEVMLGQDYNESCDVFSYGIVLLEIITRVETTSQLRPSSLKYALDVDALLPMIPKDCPPSFLKLAFDCTEYDPDQRPTFKEITERLKSLTKKLGLGSNMSINTNSSSVLPPLRTLVQSPQPSPIHSPTNPKSNHIPNSLNLNGNNHVINSSRFDNNNNNSSSNNTSLDESDYDDSDLESDDDTDNSRPNSSNSKPINGNHKMGYIIKHFNDSNFDLLLSPTTRSSSPLLNLNSKSPTPIILSPSASKQLPQTSQEDKLPNLENNNNIFSPISLLPTFTNIISTNSITSITTNITNNLLISQQTNSNPNNIQISSNSSFTPFTTRTVQS